MRRSASFAAPLRESFFDLAQRYQKLRQSAFKSKSGRTKKAPAPVARAVRERRLTDLPPPLPADESVSRSIYADSFVSEAPEEATLVQPLARRHSEPPPPPVSERRAFATLRPPPPPDPLPRLLPSTMPPPPVALATLPPPPPPTPPSMWRPMLATAAMSATIGAIVSVSLWAMRGSTSQLPLRPTVVATAAPLAATTIAPCPIPASFAASTAPVSALSTPARNAPTAVSLEALPVEATSPRAVASPVLRAPAVVAQAAPRARASTSHTGASSRAGDAEQPVASRAVAAESEHRAKRSHKSEDSDEDTSSAAAAAPPPAPTAGPDRAAIARAVARAASAASSCDASPQSGRALLTFAPSGNVQSVALIESFSDNSVNGCVLRALGRAHVAPFAGDAIQVRKALRW